MIRLNDKTKHPHYFIKKWYHFWFWRRHRLIRDVEIMDGDLGYRFRCGTLREYSRCVKMFIKEPGTCEWIKNELKPGEIFYDIGANIGVYTILAAKTTGSEGQVFAFEPHSANFTRLLDNIAVNNLQDIVTPCNFALDDDSGLHPFNYQTIEVGASNSQLASSQAAPLAKKSAQIAELKYAASIDSLVTSGKFAAPHHIKIDVDGNELPILHGMKNLISSPQRPRSIQVEVEKDSRVEIPQFMQAHHYKMSEKHYTRAGLKHIERGGAADNFISNMIFKVNA